MRIPVSSLFWQSALKPYPLFCHNSRFCKTLTTTTMKTLDESDVGILCFISNLPGFRGILKQRSPSFLISAYSFRCMQFQRTNVRSKMKFLSNSLSEHLSFIANDEELKSKFSLLGKRASLQTPPPQMHFRTLWSCLCITEKFLEVSVINPMKKIAM